jgi:hypothetical protein
MLRGWPRPFPGSLSCSVRVAPCTSPRWRSVSWRAGPRRHVKTGRGRVPCRPPCARRPCCERWRQKVAVIEVPGLAKEWMAAGFLAKRLPARRRAEFLPGLPVRAQPVIGRALFRVAQHLVGFGNLLEARLGVLFLADVGVVFARQLAVGFFDLVGRGVALHTHGLVVVLVFHETFLRDGLPAGHLAPRGRLSQKAGKWGRPPQGQPAAPLELRLYRAAVAVPIIQR